MQKINSLENKFIAHRGSKLIPLFAELFFGHMPFLLWNFTWFFPTDMTQIR